MTPEEAIRLPMVIQPPIAGNLDCRARSFHSELCFDIATFRIQLELRESFRLLQRGILTPLHPEEGAPPPNMFFIDALLAITFFHFSIGEGASKEAASSGCHSTPLPQAIMPDIGASGIPSRPQLEHKFLSRDFTLNKWTSMTAYGGADQGAPAGPEQPESQSKYLLTLRQ
ncbi:hypothetical protein CK203_044630 [Vitis vinifera]|uniref:Uncharacterized protein n=1 Tax=Vitis vinifera TaxID=29760 RepID=A0A438HJJ5_VITVI|nr:hypothetical protein CK203_044630 [Vitis vinifera]